VSSVLSVPRQGNPSQEGDPDHQVNATVAALYVERDGAYYGLPGVDPWDAERDARLYAGPLPVVAHPPCERWGRYWKGQPGTKNPKQLGDDDGCFAAALAAVERWGGVLEHPEASHAWSRFGIPKPPKSGGWVQVLRHVNGRAWTCCVEQGHYGHKARKATWLYAVLKGEPPDLIWGKAEDKIRLEAGFHTAEERARAKAKMLERGELETQLERHRHPCSIEWLPKKERARTPEPFRDLLLDIARRAW
jgi:hypothetical protein